jgi:hypothetical protein
MVVAELQEAALACGQEGKVGRCQCLEHVLVPDRQLDHAPPVPAGAVVSLAPFGDLGTPIVPSRPVSLAGVEDRKAGWQNDRGPRVVRRRIDNPNPSGCQATVSATAEPAFFADAVDDRALNSQAGERFKRYAPGRVEARSGVEEAFSSVGNEIFELDMAAERCSHRASDGPNEMKVI